MMKVNRNKNVSKLSIQNSRALEQDKWENQEIPATVAAVYKVFPISSKTGLHDVIMGYPVITVSVR